MENNNELKKSTIYYDSIDILKLILCIFVVFIHTGFGNAFVYPYVRIAVPCFFIITGFFTFLKLDNINDNIERNKTVKKIIIRYLHLYLFWFICTLPYTLYIRQYFNDGFLLGILKIIKSFFFGSTFPASWYIMASIISIIIIYKCSLKFSNSIIILITFPFYLISTVSCEFLLLIKSNPILNEIYYIINYMGAPQFNFCIALLYIAIGKVIADNIKLLNNKKLYLLLCITSLILLVYEYRYISTKNYFIYNNDCLLMLFPVSLFLVLYTLNIHIAFKFSKNLRNITTIIYCSHIPVSAIIAKLLSLFEIEDSVHIIQFLITFILCFLGSLFILHLQKYKYFKFFKYSY